MLEFNKILQELCEHYNSIEKTTTQLKQANSTELVRIVSRLDKDKKGYLTLQQLSSNNTSQEYLSYLNSIFQSRVSYSVLISFLQNGSCQIHNRDVGPQRVSAISRVGKNIQNQFEQKGERDKAQQKQQKQTMLKQRIELSEKDIIELVYRKYQQKRLQTMIRMNIHNYVISHNRKIYYQQFQQYCHEQNLAINPKLVFLKLCFPADCLQIAQSGESVIHQKTNANTDKADQRVARLRATILRLKERVDHFGSEWL